MKMIFYFLLEILGIALFVFLGVNEITGSKGTLISMVGLAMIIYSTYNLFKKNMPFRYFFLFIVELISGSCWSFVERDDKLNSSKKEIK